MYIYGNAQDYITESNAIFTFMVICLLLIKGNHIKKHRKFLTAGRIFIHKGLPIIISKMFLYL